MPPPIESGARPVGLPTKGLVWVRNAVFAVAIVEETAAAVLAVAQTADGPQALNAGGSAPFGKGLAQLTAIWAEAALEPAIS
ncbi:MAG: hypothetical protein J0H62_02555, partial [Rhizobiales bacterium]|nr:hypothetical protein [Hyphomicrobiales bacterium]